MVELLAPAGSIEGLRAAVENGADAVYLGFGGLHARMKAAGFTPENIAKHISFCHQNGVKVYVTLNSSVKETEFEVAENIIKTASSAGADAIILGDLGILSLVKKIAPDMQIHASTQLGVHNLEGAKLLKDLGFSRIILARETGLSDIKNIKKHAGIDLECFVHGAMCVAFSGNCLLSASISGNSGTRGLCLQPCRQKYKNSEGGKPAYRLSMADLCLVNRLQELENAGVSSFKIEGRLRRAQYVAEAVREYRAALDGKKPRENAVENLKLAYNRGDFSEGFLFGDAKKLIFPDIQGHIGVLAGTVTKCQKEKNSYKITARATREINSGDGFKAILGGRELFGGTFISIKKISKEIFMFNSGKALPNGTKIHLTSKRNG